MKLKNLKAQNRRNTGNKSSDSTLEFDEIHTDEDKSLIVRNVQIVKKRKRGKMFTQEEQELLQSLVQSKYSECLDISQTREAIANRKSSWFAIHEEFNAAKLNIPRDLAELKIKYKNMKSNGKNFNCSERPLFHQSSLDTLTYTIEEELHSVAGKSNTPMKSSKTSLTPARNKKLQKVVVQSVPSLDEDDTEDEFDTEDDMDDLNFIPLKKSKLTYAKAQPMSTISNDETALRRENLMLKNACLKKKERLLELQIALAERNLRRHQLNI